MKPDIIITSSTVNHNENTTDMTQVFQMKTSKTTDDFTESDISITGSYITSFENLGYSIENTIAGWDSDTSLNIDNQSGRNHTAVISGDGTTIATCYDTERGEWRIFKDISNVWTQVGSTLLDTQDASYSVTNGITLNYDGTVIAFSTGERIYTYHYENDVWSQTGDISGWGGVVQQESSSESLDLPTPVYSFELRGNSVDDKFYDLIDNVAYAERVIYEYNITNSVQTNTSPVDNTGVYLNWNADDTTSLNYECIALRNIDLLSTSFTYEIYFYSRSHGGGQFRNTPLLWSTGNFFIIYVHRTSRYLLVRNDTHDTINVITSGTNNSFYGGSSYTGNHGGWYHVVYTQSNVNGNTLSKIYVNGVLNKQQTTTGESHVHLDDTLNTFTNNGSSYIPIGVTQNGPPQFMCGKVSYAKIWTTALTDSQVQDLYSNRETISISSSEVSEPVSYFNHFLEQAQQSPYLDISVAETEVIECVSLNTIVNVVSSNGNKYVFNNSNSYTEGLVYGLYDGSYTFTDISENHPMAILNDGKSEFISYTGDTDKKFTKDVDGVSYDFYYGDMSVSISGDFDVVSIYCYYHGYMGGENLLTYDISCEQIPTTNTSYKLKITSNNSDTYLVLSEVKLFDNSGNSIDLSNSDTLDYCSGILNNGVPSLAINGIIDTHADAWKSTRPSHTNTSQINAFSGDDPAWWSADFNATPNSILNTKLYYYYGTNGLFTTSVLIQILDTNDNVIASTNYDFSNGSDFDEQANAAWQTSGLISLNMNTLSGNFQYIYLNTANMGSWANALIEVKGSGIAGNAARLTCIRELQVWVDVNGTSTNVATAAGGAEVMFVDPSTDDETITMVDGANDYGGLYPITEILNNSISNSFGMQGIPSGYSHTEFVNSYSVLLKLPTTYNSTDLQSIVVYSRTNSHGASINWNVKILDENQSTLYETASITTDHVEETGPDRSTWTIHHTNTQNIFRFDTTSLPTDLLVNSGNSSTTGVINKSGVVSIVEVINIDSTASQLGSITSEVTSISDWTLVGSSIEGTGNNHYFGRKVAINYNGDIIAVSGVGSWDNKINTNYPDGMVAVYQYANNTWSQLGSDILGLESDSFRFTNWPRTAFGSGLALNKDGDILAASSGGYNSSRNSQGHWVDNNYIKVYKYINNDWSEIGLFDNLGSGRPGLYNSLNLNNDGTRIIFGRPYGNSSTSEPRVYEYSETTGNWTQMGSNFGSTGGVYVQDLNGAGTRAIIGARYPVPGTTNDVQGYGYIYDWDDTTSSWVAYTNADGESNFTKGAGGNDAIIYTGSGTGTNSWGIGGAISNDGNVVAWSQTQWGPGTGNPGSTGRVQIFSYNETTSTWSKMGSDISGEKMWSEREGEHVRLNDDGTIIVISSTNSDTDWTGSGTSLSDYTGLSTNEGQVRVFQFDGTDWVQFGTDIEGVSTSKIGGAIDMNGDGSRIVVGAGRIHGGDTNGSVSVYYIDLPEQDPEYEQYYITHTIPNTVGLYTLVNFAASLAMNRAGDVIFVSHTGPGRHYLNYSFALVYKQVSGVWSQRGNMMTIMNGDNNFGGTYGFSKAIFSDDGDTIAISYAVNQVGITNGMNHTGDIRVVTYDSSSDTWVFKGNYIDNAEISTSHHTNGQIFSMGTDGTANAATGARFIGKSSFDLSSDGSIIAIYSFLNYEIIIYKYENTYSSSWDTIGTISTTRKEGGLSMNSDGTRVAFSNGATDFIEVWEYVSDNNWVKISSGITENNFSLSNQGVPRSYASTALRLNDDGDTLIYAGSTSDDGYNTSGFGTEGEAYVYTYAGSGTTWTQKGQTLPCTAYHWCNLAINGPGNIIAVNDREEGIVNYGGTSLRIYEYNTANDQWVISQTLLNTVQIENEASWKGGWMFIAMNYLGDRIITSEHSGIEANIYERDPSFVRYVEIIQDTSSTPRDYYTPRRNHINLSSIEIYINSSSLSITNDMVSSSTGWNNDKSYENYLNQTNTFFNTAASENGTSILIDLSQNYLYSTFNAVRIVAPSSTNFNPGIKINLLDGESTVLNATQIPLDASSSESCIIIYNDSSVLPTSDYSETIQSGTSSETEITETITCMYATSAVDVVSSDGNKYIFNGSSSYVEDEVYGMYDGYYVWSDISESHPMAILNDGKTDFITYIGDEDKKLTTQVNDVSYDFYYGNLQVSVSGDFGYVSVYCYHHGYMGGENRLKYTDTCSDVRVSSSYIYDLIGTSKSGKNMSLNNAGDIMAVGHPRHDIDNLEGSVLIWKYDALGTWNQIGNLVHEHGYGYACGLNGDGDMLILGSPIVPSGQFYSMGQGDPYIEAGLVRVFQYKTITESEYNAGNTLNHLNESGLTIIGSGSLLSTVEQNIPWSSTTYFWVQIGSDFQGTHHYSHMGKSVDIDQSGNHIGFTSVDSSNVAQIHLYTLDTSSNTWDSFGNTITMDSSCSSIRLSKDGQRLFAWDDEESDRDTAVASVYAYDSSENLWIEEDNNSHLGWQDLSGTDLSQNRSLDMSKDGNKIIRSLEGQDIELYARNTLFQVSVHVLGYIQNNSIFVQEGVFHDTDDISNSASNVFKWKYDSPHTLHSVQFIEDTNNFDFDLVAFEFSGQLPVEFTFKHIFYQRGFIEGVDSSAVAVIDVSASDYNDLFKLNFPFFYPSDNFYEFIGTLRYLTKASGWTDISFSTAAVNSGYISSATTIKRDVLRSFIKDLTGSPNLNRLFKNKLPMMLEVETLDVSFNTQIRNLLGAIENAGWLTDDDYNALQPDNQTYSFDGTFENYSGGEDISDVSAGYANLADMSEFSKFNPLRILSSSILGEPDADTADQFDISGAGLGNRIRRNILIDSLQTQVEQHWNDISGRSFVSQIGDDLYNVYMQESAAIAAGTEYIEQNGALFSSYLSNLTVYTDTSNVPMLTAENSLLQNVVDKEYSFSFISGDNLHILLTYNPEHPVMGNKRVSPRCYEVILRMT